MTGNSLRLFPEIDVSCIRDMRDRVEAYKASAIGRRFPGSCPMLSATGFLQGVWAGGQDYRGSGYYGSYLPSYLERVWALFPDMRERRYMHLFSGSLGPDNSGVRLDVWPERNRENAALRPSLAADARSQPFAGATFDFVIADTPYSAEHAKRYGTTMPNRLTVMNETARVTKAGGFLVWLDTKWPMFRKAEWRWCGLITVVQSTNHDYRGASIYERVGGDA